MKTFISIFTFIIFSFTQGFAAEDVNVGAGFEVFSNGDKALGSSGFWGGAGWTKVVENPALRKKAAMLSIKNRHTAYGKWGGDWKLPNSLGLGETIWFSVHTFFPEDFDYNSYGEGNRLKFLRLGTKSSSGKHLGFNDLYINPEGTLAPFRFIYEGTQKWRDIGIANKDAIVKGKWENYQMAITLDSKAKDDGGTAEILVWKNGKLVDKITSLKTLKNPTDYVDRALLFTYWNGGAPKDQSMYVDEIVITNIKPEWTDKEGRPIVPFYTDACRLPAQ